ncbi:MAG: class I SAM-dependent methyltransferase [Hyphomicrobiaceae bacterium]
MIAKHDVANSYKPSSHAEAAAAYDQWSSDYEADLFKTGHRNPGHLAAVFTRFIPPETQPILDAGCGGGLQAEPLALLGYGPITGIDFSEGMLAIARAKEIYTELRRMILGEPLDLPSNHFAAVLACACITPGHAPASCFDELIRVCKPGGHFVFSLREDAGQLPEYPAALERHEKAGNWEPVFRTARFQSMPYGEKDVSHRIHVYRVLAG